MEVSTKMRRLRRLVGDAVLCSLLVITPAAQSAAMETGELTSQPIGHYEFCKAMPAECAVRPRDQRPASLTKRLWSTISSVNTSVNRAVRPLNDRDIYGKDEVWAYPTKGVGDCEDYVLEKRRVLAKKGISLANLLITVVRKPDGQGRLHPRQPQRHGETVDGDGLPLSQAPGLEPYRALGQPQIRRQHDGRRAEIAVCRHISAYPGCLTKDTGSRTRARSVLSIFKHLCGVRHIDAKGCSHCRKDRRVVLLRNQRYARLVIEAIDPRRDRVRPGPLCHAACASLSPAIR